MSDERDDTATTQDIYDLDPDRDMEEDRDQLVQDAVAAIESRFEDDEAPTEGQGDLAELQERHLRTLADFENYRRRSERDRLASARTARAEPLREFLGVVDNLERALGSEGDQGDVKAGVEMILKQIRELLRRFGVEEIPAVGEPFDPSFHEAVMRFEDPDVSEQTVTEELQKGYTLAERLLRPSMVKVAVPGAKLSGSSTEPGD
ncbi:MAG: nucleotide exchange factor GrpE [Acidobacteriota bacterium]|nr:nucleotide exchange factor GrpE [Acidobacteriota bacterium]